MRTRQPALPGFRSLVATALVVAAGSLGAAAALLAAPAHAAPTWQPAHVAAADGRLPAIAVDDSGTTYAAWTTNTNVQLAVKPAGGAWQIPETLSTAPAAKTQFSPGPAIGVDAQGTVTVAWREQLTNGSLAIKAARRTKTGTITSEEIAANAFPGDSFDLSVSRNGGAAIAYFTNGASGGRLTVAVRPAGAVEFADAESLPLSIYPFDTPVVDIGEDGTVAAAYSPYAVWAVVRPPGGPWGSPEPVEPEVSRSANANITVESNGNVVIAYFGDGGKLTVRERPKNGRFGAAETLAGPAPTGSGTADFLAPIALARARDNDLTIAWRQITSPTEHSVYAAERPEGGTLGPAERIASGGPVEYVRAAVDVGGAATVSWRGFDDPATQNSGDASDHTGPVLAATRPPGAVFFSLTTLIGAGAAAPSVDAGPSGTALVGWGHSYDGGACSQIEAAGLSDGPIGGAPITKLCTPAAAAATPGIGPVNTGAPPRIRLSTRKAQRVVEKRLLKLSFVCTGPCSGLITSSVRHKPRRGTRAVKSVKLATSKYMASERRRVTIRYKLTSGQLTAIKKMLSGRGKARFVARIVTFDAAGNRSVTTAQIPLKR